jgi:hypothetical protein
MDHEAVLSQEIQVAFRRFRTRLAFVTVATLVIDVVFTVLVYFTERGAPDAFHTIWESGFWVTTQLLTVSSQLPNPHNTLTKLIDVALEAWAVFVVAALAGIVTDWLHHRTRHRAQVRRAQAARSRSSR